MVLPKNRLPTPPGKILAEEFLAPRKMTQTELAARMGVPRQRVNRLIHGARAVTAEMALLLAKVLGTTPEFWMGLQSRQDLWVARKKFGKAPR